MIKVLFVCHGNICRSVSAQYILQYLAKQSGVSEQLLIDSAATSTEEIGNPIYPPMRCELEKHGIPIGNHRSRQLKASEYTEWDYIIGMDEENMFYMKRIFGSDPEKKLYYLMEFTDNAKASVADPWYDRDFFKAYSDITAGCKGLMKKLSF